MLFLSALWTKIIRIGYAPEMEYADKMRLITINAFMAIILIIVFLFCTAFAVAGAPSALQGFILFPFVAFVFYLNHKNKISLARVVLIVGLILILTTLAFLDRRTGTEYTVMAMGCCSVLLFEELYKVTLCFVFAFACYLSYYIYDATHQFYPDPRMPYEVSQNTIVFLSAFIIVAQSLVFRHIISTYSDSLRMVNEEVYVKNKELENSNELLRKFSDNLDKLVQEKTAQLKAYTDAIDLYTCSAVITTDGYFTRVNNVFAQLSGYAVEELVGQNVSMIMPDHSREFLTERYKQLAGIGNSWIGELKIKRKNAGYNWTDCVFIPVSDNSGKVTEYLYIGFLSTERKNHQHLKEETLKLLETIAYRTSHKIRGPIASIQGLSMLIQNNMLEAKEFPMIADMFVRANDELKVATTDLAKFVNDYQIEYLGDKPLN